jgi:glutathione S-transferase
MAAEEKGITHELKAVGENLASLHPYKKFPILEHNGFRVFETEAICNYIDAVFDGPSLVPADVKRRATMQQWISCVDCYIYGHGIRDYALQYIFAGASGPDRAKIDASLPLLQKDCDLLDAAYGPSGFLVGESLTLGDLFVAPIVQTVVQFPEGREIIQGCKNLYRAYERIAARPSFKAVTPSV